jgi:hypothetical protein
MFGEHFIGMSESGEASEKALKQLSIAYTYKVVG